MTSLEAQSSFADRETWLAQERPCCLLLLTIVMESSGLTVVVLLAKFLLVCRGSTKPGHIQWADAKELQAWGFLWAAHSFRETFSWDTYIRQSRKQHSQVYPKVLHTKDNVVLPEECALGLWEKTLVSGKNPPPSQWIHANPPWSKSWGQRWGHKSWGSSQQCPEDRVSSAPRITQPALSSGITYIMFLLSLPLTYWVL